MEMNVSYSMENLVHGSSESCLINRGGWYVPEKDKHAYGAILREVNDINYIMPHCDKTRTAIQAGGCFGVWAKELSKYYDRVFCFEPEEDNFNALIKNVGNIDNIVLIRAALSDKNGRGSIDRIDPKNIGAHRIKEGNDFDVLALDFLGIDDVDLIQLDVEGCEHLAILGALRTIEDYSPLICLELKGLGNTYGHADSDTMELMRNIGYMEVERFHRDVLFKRFKDFDN